MADRSFLAELKIPVHADFIPVAKMVAATLGGMLGFSLEEIDELKIAVAQAFDSIQDEVEQLWGAEDTLLKLVYGSTGAGITVDLEAIGPSSVRSPAPPRPKARPAIPRLPRPVGLPPTTVAERALQRDMIRLFVDDFRQQVDSGSGEIRFRMVKYLIN
ncbi:MAG: hypothetical protein ACREQM_00615 [Candidatus Dormibacteraceae bacterium]